MQTARRVDQNSPEVRAFREEMRRGVFTREGTMAAFPLCFPGETAPIVHDESRITALDAAANGNIFGGAGGRQAHLFVAGFHGITGAVFDFGMPSGATRCEAVCCGASRVFAFVNGPRGGRAVSAPLVSVSEDLIQEWSFNRPALRDLGECVPGEPVAHAARDDARAVVVGSAARHLFTLDPASAKIQVVGEIPAAGRIAFAPGGAAYGRDGAGHLWQFDPQSSALRRQAVPLPQGDWDLPLTWAKDPRNRLLFTADRQGRIFSFDEKRGFTLLGAAPYAPVGPMAVTFDGRLFGFCADEIAVMFSLDPCTREVVNLGVAASVIERRRYGYEFGDAALGRDGEIVFGENDNGGHLWLYFPRIRG